MAHAVVRRELALPIREDGYLSDGLRGEIEIHWIEDISDVNEFPYVREQYQGSATRRGAMRYRGQGRMVGYAVLHPKARGAVARYFMRRVFLVTPWDRGQTDGRTYNVGGPSEAVDPRRIAPGVTASYHHRLPSEVLAQTRDDLENLLDEC